MEKQWLLWARELQSISQSGLTYCKSDYDLDRYRELEKLSQEIIKRHTDVPEELIKEYYKKEDGYLTPKVDVRGAVISDNKILLVKEKVDGRWCLPGGWGDVNRSISENVKKEAFEEAGVLVETTRLVGVLDRSKWVEDVCPYTIYKIFILCDLLEGGFQKNTETDESRFFLLDALPPLSKGRTTAEQLALCFKAYSDPNFIPIFD
ncbi:MAG TPA: NUDIX hydrolase [Acetobacterium sp.]|uniref:NUDIX hydrolase n=1 Tax=Acetobacterium sp. TaxID=1872094 RepID=UPI002F412711